MSRTVTCQCEVYQTCSICRGEVEPSTPDVNTFVFEIKALRNGSPNAYYSRVDAFCREVDRARKVDR